VNLRLVRRGTPLTIQIPFSMFSRPDIELSVTVTFDLFTLTINPSQPIVVGA
jgi:hypothetical protein